MNPLAIALLVVLVLFNSLTGQAPLLAADPVDWQQQALTDAKQDRITIAYDGITPNKMVCDTTLRKMPDGSWIISLLAGDDFEPSPKNYIGITRSTDEGKTWSPVEALDTTFPRSGITSGQGATEIVTVGKRSTMFFSTHSQTWGRDWQSWRMHSSDSGRTWSKPEPLPGRLAKFTFIRGHIVTRDGRLLIPFQHYLGPPAGTPAPPPDEKPWHKALSHYVSNPRNGVLISSDGGQTFTEHGNIRLTNDDRYHGWAENSLVELADGRIAMLIRGDRLGGVLYYAESKDGGETWPELAAKTEIPNPGSKATLYGLGGDAVALLHNPNPKHRSPLALWVSFDGMQTWPYQRVLVAESVDGPQGRLNYPDGYVSDDKQWLHFAFDDNRHRAVSVRAKLPPLPHRPAKAAPAIMKPQEHKHLMLDSRLFKKVEHAKLVPGTPLKAAENPLFQADQPWENSLNNLYPNVWWDEREGVFKLWYKCVLADKEVIAKMDGPRTVHDVGWYLLYATSRDGLRWEKPALGLFKHDGSTANNIVARDCPNVGVFQDVHDPDATRRYKMVFDEGLGKPRVRFSADGIHWGQVVEAQGFGPQNGDTHNNAVWDAKTGKYLWFTKLYLGERTMARFQSEDFLHWKNDGMVLRSTIHEGRNSQTYCLTPFRYGNIWLGYQMIYHPGFGRSVDCELAWSPDGLNWERVLPGTPWIPRGTKGSYDSECIYAMSGPPIVQDGKLLIFYGGDDFPHTGWKRNCLPCLARLPLDHFAGYAPIASEKSAKLVTQPLVLTEEPIRITANTENGSLAITAVDANSAVVDQADLRATNATDLAVKWKMGGLAKHVGQRIQLHIELNQATIWSLSGAELVDSSLPVKASPFKAPSYQPAPLATHAISFDQNTQGWKGVAEIAHHPTGGAAGGYVSVTRVGPSPPIAFSPATAAESPLAGNWPQRFGGNRATVSCQVRAAKAGGKVQLELFAGDLANWSFQSDVPVGPEWKTVTATLRYDWSDAEATAAGWRRAANGFGWSDTIQNIGKVVVVPAAAEAQERFDLDEVLVRGEQ